MVKTINVKLTEKNVLHLAVDELKEKSQIVIEFTGYQHDLFRLGRYLTKHLLKSVVETPQYNGKAAGKERKYHIIIRRKK